MQAYSLLEPEGKAARLRALEFLREPLRYKTSISLYGRLSYAAFSKSSFLITNEDVAEHGLRLIACVDRARRPETELWLYGEWEISQSLDTAAVKLVLADLFNTVKALPVAESMHGKFTQLGDTEVDYSGLDRTAYARHAMNENIILCGAVHEKTYPLIKALGLLNAEYEDTEIPFLTYIFEAVECIEQDGLSEGLWWDALEHKHMSLVLSRTFIPRQASTLASLPSIGIFPAEGQQPVAWGFVGVDGSLSTLHVEPEYRKRGLAKALTRKLLRDKMEVFSQGDAPHIGHSHVAWENLASKALCESIGGKADWSVYWLRVDGSKA